MLLEATVTQLSWGHAVRSNKRLWYHAHVAGVYFARPFIVALEHWQHQQCLPQAGDTT